MRKNLIRQVVHSVPVLKQILQIRDAVDEVRDLLGKQEVANTIRILDFELKSHPRYTDPRRLMSSAFQVCSQNGEDGMIDEIFRRIGTKNKVFAEVGVGDGAQNNTAFLLAQGWQGYWVDASDSFLKKIEGRPDLSSTSLRTAVASVSRENIAEVFAKMNVPDELDLLSLDIDQNTYYLWTGLSKLKPRVVVVEYNSAIPPHIDWKARYYPDRIWDGTNNYGAGLKCFELFGASIGYSLVGCDFFGVNAFFVREELVGEKFCAPFTAENHYEPGRFAMVTNRNHRSAILDRME